MAEQNKKRCNRCGKCCKEGGPALHEKDLGLVRDGKIRLNSLITLKKGELIYNPLTGNVQPAGVELIKIVGKGGRWTCCYHDEHRGCTIYPDRPQACVLLKCWNTNDILDLVERETLSRFDILVPGNPLIPAITEHERICPCPDLLYIRDNSSRLSVQQEKELEKLVGDDLRFRTRVIADFNLELGEELFYFGRPLFQILQAIGVILGESKSATARQWKM